MHQNSGVQKNIDKAVLNATADQTLILSAIAAFAVAVYSFCDVFEGPCSNKEEFKESDSSVNICQYRALRNLLSNSETTRTFSC